MAESHYRSLASVGDMDVLINPTPGETQGRDRLGHRSTGSAAAGFPCRLIRSPAGTPPGTGLGAPTALKR